MKVKNLVFATFTIMIIVSLAAVSFAGDPYIGVAADSKETNAVISSKAARAPYFLLYDQKGAFLEATMNPAIDRPGGAGNAAATFLAEHKVKKVVAGDFGSKMTKALQELQIEYLKKEGVADVVVQTIINEQ